jgi:hypothetical protein
MSSNAIKSVRRVPSVPGTLSFPTQTFVICSQAAEASKTPTAKTASAGKRNVTFLNLSALPKVILMWIHFKLLIFFLIPLNYITNFSFSFYFSKFFLILFWFCSEVSALEMFRTLRKTSQPKKSAWLPANRSLLAGKSQTNLNLNVS